MAGKATLRSKVSLNTSEFQRGVRGMRRVARRFSRQFGRPFAQATRNLVRMGVVAGALAAGAMAVMIRKAASFGDQMDKMSKRTGISTEELSRLSHAADLSGSSIEDLEKGVRTMQKRILDLERGLSTSVDAFTDLGVSLDDVKDKTPEAQLNILMEALAGVNGASRRAALAQDIFGRAGTKMLPMLSDGVEGLRAMKGEADKLGILVTADQAKAAADFTDEVQRLKSAIFGLFITAVGFGDMNRGLKDLTGRVIEFRKSAQFRDVVAGFSDMVKKIVNGTIRIVRAWQSTSEASRESLRNMALLFTGFIIAWRAGFIVPFVQLLFFMAKTVVTQLVLMLTNFAAFQAGMLALSRNMKIVMLGFTKAVAFPLIALAALVAGLGIGKIIEKQFDLSGGLARAQLKTQAGFARAAARLKLDGKELVDELARIALRLKEGLEIIDDSADVDAGFLENFKAAAAETRDEVGDVFDDIADIASKPLESIKELIANLKKPLEVNTPEFEEVNKLKKAVDAAQVALDKLRRAGRPIRGFFIDRERKEREGRAARERAQGAVLDEGARELLDLPADVRDALLGGAAAIEDAAKSVTDFGELERPRLLQPPLVKAEPVPFKPPTQARVDPPGRRFDFAKLSLPSVPTENSTKVRGDTKEAMRPTNELLAGIDGNLKAMRQQRRQPGWV